MTDSHVRPAHREDLATILRYIKELAVYEREPEAVVADERMLEDALFCDAPKVFALVCEQAGEAVGLRCTSSTSRPGWAGTASTSRTST